MIVVFGRGGATNPRAEQVQRFNVVDRSVVMDQTLVLTFPGAPKDRANIFADDLRQELKRRDSSLSIEKRRESETAQDFAATLAVIVTSAAVTALAKGIANFIAKHGTKIRIKIGEDVVEATGIESKDAPAIMSAMEKYQKGKK
jgi:uncharacterized protein YajQ (UPF0234 family)